MVVRPLWTKNDQYHQSRLSMVAQVTAYEHLIYSYKKKFEGGMLSDEFYDLKERFQTALEGAISILEDLLGEYQYLLSIELKEQGAIENDIQSGSKSSGLETLKQKVARNEMERGPEKPNHRIDFQLESKEEAVDE